MEKNVITTKSLIETIISKGCLKQEVYRTTLDVFNTFKKGGEILMTKNKAVVEKAKYPLAFNFKDRGQFEFRLKFGSDVLIFFMHSNVFEIPRDHEVMKTSYIKEDKTRSYCGIIHIFNFLADSFKYNRTNDIGYCIGRIFVNRERHYFIEGKREVGLLYNNFPNSILDEKSVQNVLHGSILYTLNFDLLTPPFDNIKEVTAGEMQTTLDAFLITTGKRLGFRFQADNLNTSDK
ncbi:MAG: hypothetical protein M0P58_12590 [Bacteroidales bacterium]|nr:hypothetical protein [Bacteroidales bacterium]